MDPTIWSKIPDDILTKVLARTSYKGLHRLRCVCKKWNALIISRPFTSQIVTRFCPKKPLLLRAVKGFPAVIGYNPTLQEWRCLPLTFVNEEFKIRFLVASGGGLLCFSGKAGKLSAALMVCNPLIKEWKVLPPLPRKPVVYDVNLVKLLIPDEETKSYKIFLADLHEGCVVAQIYESLSNQWTTHSAPARYQLLAQGVFVNGSVHFMASKWVGMKILVACTKQECRLILRRRLFRPSSSSDRTHADGGNSRLLLHCANCEPN